MFLRFETIVTVTVTCNPRPYYGERLKSVSRLVVNLSEVSVQIAMRHTAPDNDNKYFTLEIF